MKERPIDIPKFNIVLAEDDPDDRYMFNEAFRELRLDIHTHIVEDGLALMKYMNGIKELPDIIFLDINMPLMNGLECLKALRKEPEYANTCIVIFSTSSTDEDIEQTFVLGANIYLIKPNSFNELKDLLYKVILFNSYYQGPHIKRENFVLSLGTKS